MKTYKQLALDHSATSFLNSFLLEWDQKKVNPESIEVTLLNRSLLLPLKIHSSVGRHHYQTPYYLLSNGEKIELEFLDLVKVVVEDLSVILKTDESQKNHFLSRVMNSADNIEEYLRLRFADFSNLSSKGVNFKEAEQGLFVGHTFHPTPKSRSEFDPSSLLKYSPETAGHFPLHWFLLHKSIFFQKLAQNYERPQWVFELFQNEFNDKKTIEKDYIPFPVHPWQKKYLLKNKDIADYLNEKLIIDLGASDKEWFPTSSLRTLYAPHSEYMLKFSMNLRLTNSVRNLLVHELDRGLQVHDVFTHSEGEKFSKENPTFEVIHEPVYAGIKDSQGEIIQESLIVGRFNPFMKDSEAIVVATLTQDDLEFGHNRLYHYVQNLTQANSKSFEVNATAWFKKFLDVSIVPLIEAQANYGILLGAHQQNLILEMKENLPIRSYFRDCNGTGYSELGHSLFGKDVKSLVHSNGNILDKESASFLFGYYVIINSTFNILSSLAHSGKVTEEKLLQVLRSTLKSLKDKTPKDSSFIDYLLYSPTLQHKGNFLCSLRNINENTEKNPLAIYTEISNPIFEKVSMLSDLKETIYSPLSSDNTYKAKLTDQKITVTSDKDQILILQTELKGTTLKLSEVESNQKDSRELLLIALEYVLGHNRQIQAFEAPGMNYLRSEFFQLRELWHHETGFTMSPEKWTETNGRAHPVRLAPHHGVVYKRYVPELHKTISFRLTNVEKDLDTFHEWHNQPRVSFFWELNQPKDALKAYMEKSLKDPHQFPMVIEIDDEPVGYFEFYWVQEDRLGPYYDSEAFDRGFHFLIGNKNFLGYLNTDTIIKSALHCLFLDDPRTRKVMAEPRHDNQKVLRYAEASKGWRKVKEFDFPHKRAALLECRREGFFNGDAL